MREINFDGLIGPTHNYAGLSYGNVASSLHRNQVAFPRAAALQGLTKMQALAGLGIPQAVLPPLRRPRVEFLRSLGLTGTSRELLQQAFDTDPVLLATCYSASSMWVANAATVSPSVDCADGRVHLTVANLSSTLHRSIEPPSTLRLLQAIFSSRTHFCVHPALPAQAGLADEGAANHTRLGPPGFDNDCAGLEVFVYGADRLNPEADGPRKFPARQTRLASESVARLHGLNPEACCFLQQHPAAIDAGVFHNDVIAVGNQNVLLCHELAFVDQANQLARLKHQFETLFGQPLHVIELSSKQIPLADAVSSYLFNSQLVTRPDGSMVLVCPAECEQIPTAHACTQAIVAGEHPVNDVIFFDLRQSMNNGGGPACLRLRVRLTNAQLAQLPPNVILTETLAESLMAWVERHYREKLSPDDLRDPALPTEVEQAMEDLAGIMQLPADVLLDRP